MLEGLKRKATNQELMYDVNTLSQLKELATKNVEKKEVEVGWEVSKTDRKKAKKIANSVVTECSSLTMNTNTEPTGKRVKYTPCSTCRLYHDTSKGCQFVDQKNKRFRVQKFLQHGNVRHILPSGESIVSDYWIDKLKKYIFPALEVAKESDKAKIISELKKAAAELPRSNTGREEDVAARE